MDNSKAPRCPFCGGDMISNNAYRLFWYECKDCDAATRCETTEEAAYTDAMRRPMQKPMTLEEIKSISIETPLCMEYKYYHPPVWKIYRPHRYKDIPWDELNIKWRLWRTRPTDEERAAVKWD